jgi:hypothetical protein
MPATIRQWAAVLMALSVGSVGCGKPGAATSKPDSNGPPAVRETSDPPATGEAPPSSWQSIRGSQAGAIYTLQLPPDWKWDPDGLASKTSFTLSFTFGVRITRALSEEAPDVYAQKRLAVRQRELQGTTAQVRDQRIIKVGDADAAWLVFAINPGDGSPTSLLKAACYLRINGRDVEVNCERFDVRPDRKESDFANSQKDFLKIAQSFRITSEGVGKGTSAAEQEAIAALTKLLQGDNNIVFADNDPKKSVIQVDLANNSKLTDAGLAHLKAFPNVQKLNLLGCDRITDEGMAQLKPLVSLQELNLDFTKITDKGMAEIKGLKELRKLNLETMPIGDASLAHLKGLTKLEILTLNKASVTDAGLAHLTVLPKLRWLWLTETKVTDQGLDHLKKITTLEVVNVVGTQVTAKGIADLKKSLPKVRILN